MATDQFSSDLLVLIGKELHRLRGNRKAMAAAKGVGISQPTLSHIETGKHGLSITLLFEMASYYNTSLSEIFHAVEKHMHIDKGLDANSTLIDFLLTEDKSLNEQLNKANATSIASAQKKNNGK